MGELDVHFVESLKQGDEEVMVELYACYRNAFIQWAINNYSCDPDEAKDVFQDSVIILYQNITSGKLTVLNSEIRTYLFAIGKFKLLNLLKKNSRKVTFNNSELIKGIEPNENMMEEKHDEDHTSEVVKHYLSQQSGDCQKVLEMYYFQGMDMKTIAERMGYKNADVAKKKKYECFKKLAEMVKNNVRNLVLL